MPKKHPAMEAMLEEFALHTYGTSRSAMMTSNLCVSCEEPATTFKDSVSAKEYSLSGLCQSCQDSVFDAFDALDDWEIN